MTASDAPAWVMASLAEAGDGAGVKESRQFLYSTTAQFRDDGQVVVTVRAVGRVGPHASANPVATSLNYSPFGDTIESAKAWILGPDKKTLHSYGSRDFIDTVRKFDGYSWDLRKTLHFGHPDELPDRGILAWEITYQTRPIFGEFAVALGVGDIACDQHSFEVIPSPDSHIEWWTTSLTPLLPQPGDKPGALKWLMKDQKPNIPPFPVGFIRNPEGVFCTNVSNRAGGHAPSWADVSRLIWKLGDFPVDASDPVAVKAHQLTEGKADRWTKIRAITEFVQSEITYLEFTLERDEMAGVRPHPPEQVLKNRYGDCKDKATLLVAMLRAINETAYPVIVMAENPTIVEPDHPTTMFNHEIVAIQAIGDVPAGWPAIDAGPSRLVLFDPTDRIAPLGTLPESDEAGIGLVGSNDGVAMIRLPAATPMSASMKRTTNGTLSEDGTFAGTVVETDVGRRGAREEAVRVANNEQAWRTRIESSVSKAHPLATISDFASHWEPVTGQFVLTFGASIPNFSRVLSEGTWVLSPKILADLTVTRWTTAAPGKVYWPAISLDEIVQIQLPASLSISELPTDWEGESDGIRVHLSYSVKDRELTFRETLSQSSSVMGKAEYEKFRAFQLKVVERARRPVLLKGADPKS